MLYNYCSDTQTRLMEEGLVSLIQHIAQSEYSLGLSRCRKTTNDPINQPPTNLQLSTACDKQTFCNNH